MKSIYRPLFKDEADVRGTYFGVDNFNFSMDTILIQSTCPMSGRGKDWDSGLLSNAMTENGKASLKYFAVDNMFAKDIEYPRTSNWQ